MDWLNYHHLLYFWVTAREGTVARASTKLGLAQPTVSGQIRRLEEALGEKLFARRGRRLELTEVGTTVYRYAEEIFSIGGELVDVLKHGGRGSRPMRLRVGVADVLPKTVVRRLLAPVLRSEPPIRVVCHEDRSTDEFVAELAVHTVDVVLADGPVATGQPRPVFNHRLGECGSVVFATRATASRYRRGFPRSLDGAPILLPGAGSAQRRAIEAWLASARIAPRVVAEVDDSALLKSLAQDGAGLFLGPDVVAREIAAAYDVRPVGSVSAVRHQFYAITAQRRIEHPAVAMIRDAARDDLFA